MNHKFLDDTIKKLFEKGKGILAVDESNGTCDKRFEMAGIDVGQEMRRQYREMLLGLREIGEFVSGAILYDETFWQKNSAGVQFSVDILRAGVLPGIKVDLGAKDFPEFPNEKITVGLDDLNGRVKKYADAGARFTKWRSVIKIDEERGLPTEKCIDKNISALTEYAKIVQAHNLVPIVEPEVLLDGPHSIQKSEEVISLVISKLMKALSGAEVYLPGVILKTSMVIQGNKNADEASAEEVATATVRMLRNSCPNELGGVVFLSGGQTPVEATAHLEKIAEQEPLPWPIAFSYARALQDPAMRAWAGKSENVEAGRSEFKKRLELNQLADLGEYDISLEYLD